MTSPAMAVRLMGVVLPATLRFDWFDSWTIDTMFKEAIFDYAYKGLQRGFT